MAAVTTSKEERSRIFTLREEYVPIKETCRQIGSQKAAIMHILVASCELPPGIIPPPKPHSGPKKTN